MVSFDAAPCFGPHIRRHAALNGQRNEEDQVFDLDKKALYFKFQTFHFVNPGQFNDVAQVIYDYKLTVSTTSTGVR